jgi:hypothetical protein
VRIAVTLDESGHGPEDCSCPLYAGEYRGFFCLTLPQNLNVDDNVSPSLVQSVNANTDEQPRIFLLK